MSLNPFDTYILLCCVIEQLRLQSSEKTFICANPCTFFALWGKEKLFVGAKQAMVVVNK